MTLGPINNTSGMSFTSGQEAQAAQLDETESLLNDSFGSESNGLFGALLPASGSSSSSTSSGADLSALLAAYASTKSLTPVALAYLQNMPASTTTTTFL